MSAGLAPIIIFVYRREIGGLISELKRDPLSSQSDLIIFSDGGKNSEDSADVLKVRSTLKEVNGFKSVRIVESPRNKGLAASIIDGVTDVITQYGKVIVLEDDLMVADDFLKYMNDALDFYEQDPKIWSIAGYSANLPCLETYTKDVYLAPRVNSWGWATWRDRWEKIDWEIKDWEKVKRDKSLQQQFNEGGNDLFRMLELQMLGKIDSWAIRWSYNQFMYRMYTVYPAVSKVSNEGFSDDKGMHNNATEHGKWLVGLQGNRPLICEKLDVDPVVIACFKKYYDLGFKTDVGYFLKKYGGYGIAKKMMRVMRK